MKHKKYPKFEDYDFSGCREITGDELYRINGGGRIEPEENQNPPDEGSSSSADNYTVQSGDTLSQIVYDYNQANGTHLTVDEVAALSGIENPDLILPGQSIVFSNPEQGGDSGQPVDPTNPAGSTSTSSNPSSTSSGNPSANSETTVPDFADPFAPVSNGNFGVDNVNQIISADINNPQSVIDAYNSYHIHADRGYKFQIKDGDEVVHTFSDAKYVRNYVETLDPSDGKKTLSEPLNVVSIGSYLFSEGLDKAVVYSDDALKIAKISKYSKVFSKVSGYAGIAATLVDIKNAKSNKNFDTISDVVIDVIGLIPGGGALWSIGLSCAKYGAEKLAEETDKLVKSYSDYKINEMASCYQSENERVQQMFEPSNMFWKMAENGVKQWFRRLPL